MHIDELVKPPPFDVVLTTSTGVTVPLMLARVADKNGNPAGKMWVLEEVPVPANVRVSQEGVGLVDLPPEMEAVFYRDDNTAGMGVLQVSINKANYFSGNAQTSVKGKVIKAPYVTEISLPTSETTDHVFCEATFSGTTYLYVSDGRYLHRSSNGTTFTQAVDLGVNAVITDIIFFGADDAGTGLVVAWTSSGTVQPYKYSEDGTTFSAANAGTSHEATKFFVRDKTLFSLRNPANMYSTTDPFAAAAAWAGPTVVGDLAHNFQWGVVVAAVAVIAKEDRIYTVTSAGVVQTLVSQFMNNPGPRNFPVFTVAFNGNIYTLVRNEVWEYDPVTGALRSFGLLKLPDTLLTTNATGGVAFGEDAIFAIHDTNFSNTGNAAGRSIVRITLDDKNSPIFERWALGTETNYRPSGRMHATQVFTSTTTGKHLFYSVATVGKLGRMDLPRAEDPTTDSTTRYSLEETVHRTGWITHNFPGQPKDYTEVTLDLGGLKPTNTTTVVKAYYYLDYNTTTRYTLNDNLVNNGLITLSFNTDSGSGRAIMLEFILSTTANTATPIIFSWSVRAAVKFRLREVITLGARIVDHDTGRDGSISPLSAVQTRLRLREMRSTENLAIKYKDYNGYHFDNVRILPKFREESAVDERTNNQITVLTFRVMRVSSD